LQLLKHILKLNPNRLSKQQIRPLWHMSTCSTPATGIIDANSA
jgi:hypothetical protein